ncbi:MAG: bifunctional 5,10-methylenetetrahydrofolate dehydrogenase/5,10-methenyltetrahydrofolate cyclohydrolase [Nitrososphaerales archaeon]|jgi:methylenetetrahydrofolate dehydrogenase (NADP+)/methenyltetrahydrofolate cyclohydrolase
MDGRALACQVRERLKNQIELLKAKGIEPKLETILVGDDGPSKMYLATKHKAANEVGIATTNHSLSADSSQESIGALISELNSRSDVHAILVQMPLPAHLSAPVVLARISPEKDADGLTPENVSKLVYCQESLLPCTPKGIMTLLKHYEIGLRGLHVVIINRSMLVGKPLYHLLMGEDATVTMCHSKTRDLAELTKRADIVVSAVGRRPDFVLGANMVKEGAVVVDVAMNRIDGKVVGDVDFLPVSQKASYITKVPGGVGPMTVAMLLENTIIATLKQTESARAMLVAG